MHLQRRDRKGSAHFEIFAIRLAALYDTHQAGDNRLPRNCQGLRALISQQRANRRFWDETAVPVKGNVNSTVLRFSCNIETLLPFAF